MSVTSIQDLFTQNELIDYSNSRTYKPLLGDELFPSRRVETLEVDQINRGSKTPIIASISGFDAEAEIGSREAEKLATELFLIKRKMPISEKDLYALLHPRTEQEGNYLRDNVYNDFDVLNQGVLAQVEKMTMEMLATGKITLSEKNKKAIMDYQVPANHQEALTDGVWTGKDSNPLDDFDRWINALDVVPTRALTSRKIYRLITTNAQVIAAVYGKDTGRRLSKADFDSFMEQQGFPIIRTYDEKYRVQQDDGTYKTYRYFPEDRIVLFNDDVLGEKLWGPTPEEIAHLNDATTQSVGNVYDTTYTQDKDPIVTFEKATAVSIPTFAAVDEVFQAKPI